MEFQIGDKVVYPNQGVGVVEQISHRNLTGRTEMFYLLRLNSNGLRVMVPTTNVESLGLRRVAKNREINEVFDYLNNGSIKAPHDWKNRFKENCEKMRSGSLLQVAEVFKTLLTLSQAKPLSFREKRMFERSWQLLVDEVSAVRGLARDVVEAQLVRALSKSKLKVSLPS
jgi:CarD family transcriptional regulator